MKIKADFVTNSSSTSFTFIFEGNKRTDLFKKLVKYEKNFDICYAPWNNETLTFDVWDLIENLIGLIKKGKEDRYYLPDIYPLSKLKEDTLRELDQNLGYLEEAKKEKINNINGNNYAFELYTNIVSEKDNNLKVINEFMSSNKKFSVVEVSCGNDGIIGGNFGYAMESEIRTFKKEEDFYIIIENNH